MADYYVSTSVADMTLNQGDSMYITKGGTATRTTVQSQAEIRVLSGGDALYTTCSAWGKLIVSNGGFVRNTTLTRADIFVSSGGIAGLTTLLFYGRANILSGGLMNSTTVSSGGGLTVSSGGKASNTAVFDSGTLTILSGGVANSTTVNSGASVFISNGASINSTTVNSDGHLNVSAGGTANYTVANNGADVYAVNAVLNNTTINSGGTAYVRNSGTASNTIVNANGFFDVYSGATASYTTTYGEFHLSEGAGARHTTVSAGSFFIHGGCSATSTTIESGALLEIFSGTANVNIIKSGGSALNSRGIMNSTTVKAGGVLDLRGGSALNIMEDGGYVTFSSGASMTYASNTFSGVKLGNAQSASVHSVTTANGTTVGSGGLLEVRGGRMNNTTVSSGGSVVFMGGVADGTVLSNGASIDLSTILYIAKMSNTTICSGIKLSAFDSQVQFDGVTINRGASLSIISGGTATRIKENGGYVNWVRGDVTFASNTFSGVKLGNKDSATVHSGTTANSTVISNGGEMELYWSGIANNTVISSGGKLEFLGGIAYDTVLSKGGIVTFYDLDSGVSHVRTTICSGASLVVHGHVIVDSTTVNSMGSMAVLSGGVASRTILSGGKLEVDEGGSAVGGVVGSNGGMHVYSGGVASNMSVASRGLFYVSAGGSADGIAVSSGGTLSIKSDGTADNTMLSGGLLILSGGQARFTVVEAGMVNVSSGGRAEALAVSSGGTVQVCRGGVVNGLDSYSGSLYVSAGGRATGRMYFLGDSVVSFDSGSTLDFDISIFTPGGTAACVNNLSFVTGTPDYTLTVGAGQEEGAYKLANNAAGFNRTVTVKDAEGTSLGTLKVGQITSIGGVNYKLELGTDSVLSVTVGAAAPEPEPVVVPPYLTGDFNGDLFDTLAVQKDGNVTIYQNGEPWGLGVTLEDGWNVLGTGDFNNDYLDDFLRVNTEGYVVGEMSNGNGTFTPQVLNLKNPGWRILGTGDFNGNGTSDVLIANPTGASETVGLLGYWESGVTWTLINGYSPEWTMVSTGDFNGDGECDMLWKNEFIGEGGLTYNAYCTWIVDDPTDWRMVSVANPKEWNFLCSGDFDGNGSHDIAMINNVGVVGIWGVTDGYLSSWSILSAVTSEWQLAGVADFNADGTDDIAWSNTDTGLTGYWQINNKELTTWQNIATLS